jgi:hypothetical protein
VLVTRQLPTCCLYSCLSIFIELTRHDEEEIIRLANNMAVRSETAVQPLQLANEARLNVFIKHQLLQ